MALRIASVVLLLLLPGSRAEDLDYEDISEQEDPRDYVNYDVVDDSEDAASPLSASNDDDDAIGNRIRREQDEHAANTFRPQDVNEVKEAISDILSGMGIGNPFTPYSTSLSLEFTPSSNTSTTPSSLPGETVPSFTTLLFTLIGRPLRRGFRSDEEAQKKTETTMETTTDTTTFETTTMETTSTPTTTETTTVTTTTTETTTPTPTTTPPTTNAYDGKYTGVTIAKCFVCGLEAEGIPRNAHCADAFAVDFLPVMPVDFTAKRRVAFYRKHCKYSNIRGFRVDEKRPRVVWGRWTGGCAVRWSDLTGVYTQRTCRSRLQPSTGRHYASKRMAKLERALWNIDDGCIVSPAASLTPMSRGVSLFARYHACVCTGSWCNVASALPPRGWTLVAAVALLAVRTA